MERFVSGDGMILCQITTQKNRNDEYAIDLFNTDFEKGNLPKYHSIIRTNRLFTADRQLILKKSGTLSSEKLKEVKIKIIEIIEN